jgi:hypothetical protein
VDESHTLIEGAGATPPFEVDLAHGTVFAGRYEIRRLLGRGGAGFVVQAHDRALDEQVAIKMLRPEHGAEREWIERLAREVKLARQIRHPNVCRVFDFGQADGRAFLVMELARGSLRDELRGPQAGRSLDQKLADARAVASGVAAVHAAGVVHRDVTPQNVLRMPDGRLVVSDFGLATDSDPTMSSIHGGTVAYMAPELSRGEHASFASDVWALGAILHEIVFGRRPLWRDGLFGLALEPASAGASRAERRLVEICKRCMIEHGRRRPPADEVRRLVESATDAASWSRRGRALAAVGGLATLALGLAATWTPAPRAVPAPAHVAGPAPELLVTFEGAAADWSRTSRLLGTFDQRIEAVTALPGGDAVRVVWGDPRRAEDVALATGARSPAVLPPTPPGAGPVVTSPDGEALAFEGYEAGGRPFVFLSAARADARPVPVAAAADPSLASEPRWLAGGRAFVFDADVRNVGVFSLDTNRPTILPTVDHRPAFTTFKAAVHDRILVARIAENSTSQIAIFSWPAMAVVSRFDLPAFAVEWQSDDGRHLFGIAAENGDASVVVALDTEARRARRLGGMPGRNLRTLARAGGQLVFSTFQFGGDVWVEDERGGRVVARDVHAREVARGGGHILITIRQGGVQRIARLDEEGRWRGFLTAGPTDDSPSVLPGGTAWTYLRRGGEAPGFYRCEFRGTCRRLLSTIMHYATVSPDGTRVAYVDPAPQGTRARVVGIDGQGSRDVGDASSFCGPAWSSNDTLWISRRAEGTPEWLEVDVSGPARPTGRRFAGTRDCSDGTPDPAAPLRDGARIIVSWRAELRAQTVD